MDSLNAFVKRMEGHWNAADSHGWASGFTEDSRFINVYGGFHRGREKLQRAHAYLYSGIYKNSRIELTIETAQPVAPGLVAMIVFAALDYDEGESHMDVRMGMLVENPDTDPRIAWFQNTIVSRPEHHSKDHSLAESVNAGYER